MKRVFLTVLLMGSALCAFAQSGVIRQLSGTVELTPAGSNELIPASIGSEVNQDTIVSTGFRSSAIIEVGSATLTVRPLTRLSLTEIRAAADTETVSANLQAGRVRIDVRPPAGATAAFTVHGPSATASVRGTVFEIDTRSVRVLGGSVSFVGASGAPVLVHSGGESSAAIGAATADPVQHIFAELSPPAPVGTGESGEAASVPVLIPTTGTIDITITRTN